MLTRVHGCARVFVSVFVQCVASESVCACI